MTYTTQKYDYTICCGNQCSIDDILQFSGLGLQRVDILIDGTVNSCFQIGVSGTVDGQSCICLGVDPNCLNTTGDPCSSCGNNDCSNIDTSKCGCEIGEVTVGYVDPNFSGIVSCSTLDTNLAKANFILDGECNTYCIVSGIPVDTEVCLTAEASVIRRFTQSGLLEDFKGNDTLNFILDLQCFEPCYDVVCTTSGINTDVSSSSCFSGEVTVGYLF